MASKVKIPNYSDKKLAEIAAKLKRYTELSSKANKVIAITKKKGLDSTAHKKLWRENISEKDEAEAIQLSHELSNTPGVIKRGVGQRASKGGFVHEHDEGYRLNRKLKIQLDLAQAQAKGVV